MSDFPEISGYWSGWYAYGVAAEDQRVPFSAFIEHVSPSEFVGTILEPNTFAAPILHELSADIQGEMASTSVIFEKQYHPGPDVHQELIQYLGHLSDDANHIAGEWHVGAGETFLNGVYEMTRLTGHQSKSEIRSEVAPQTAGSLDFTPRPVNPVPGSDDFSA